MIPGAGPVLAPGNKLGRGLLGDAKYLGLQVTNMKVFKVFISKIYFSLCDLDIQRTKTIEQLLKRVIPGKFGKNPASSFGDVF